MNNAVKRKLIQIAAFGFTNLHIENFAGGKLYTGKWKQFCNPGLNCYSCPAATLACPIGAMQAVAGSMQFNFSFYVIGFLLAVGVLLGRFICGWICPFGLVQELFYKIPSRKCRLPRIATYFKYGILLLFVIVLPVVATNYMGMGKPAFCQYICPSGTLFGGIPMLTAHPKLRVATGFLFALKMAVLIITLIACIFIFRFFCKTLCPLGAVYGLLNKISIYRLKVDKHSCIRCGKCAHICKMDVNPVASPDSAECIRCGACAAACPKQAIRLGFGSSKSTTVPEKSSDIRSIIMKNSKRHTILFFILLVLSLTGCSSGTKNQDSAAAPTSENGMVISNVKERGLCFSIAQDYIDKGVSVEYADKNAKGYKNVVILYTSPTAEALLSEIDNSDPAKMTLEVVLEYVEKLQSSCRCLMEVVMVETEQYDNLTANGAKPEDFTSFAPAEVFGVNEGYTYILSIPDLDDGTLNETEAAEYHDCKAYMQTVRDNITLIPVEYENGMPTFTTKDINGVTVDSSIFSEKKLTVINVWGTFCSPCIQEMPELAEWAREMGDDVQLIGIVGDIYGENDTQHIELAQTIADKANVEFVNLIPNEQLDGFMSEIIGYPTTFFVDENGAFVGEPIVGANVDGCREFVESYLSGQ